VNGVASEAVPEAGVGVPLAQLMLTFTEPPAFGTKSFWTTKVCVFSVLMIVQEALPPTVMPTLRQPDWFAV
jgi:hypothetical protein